MTARDTLDLTVRRVIRAPRQKVYDAFVKPELLRQWMGPRGFKLTALEMEPRQGGQFRLTMQHRHGDTSSVAGTYKELTPPERIVFTWGWDGQSHAPMPETLVTVTFTERKGAEGPETEVVLLHSGFPSADVRDSHNGGWQGCMNKLAEFTDVRGTAATLSLIGTPRSTYVRTVRMALIEKGLDYAFDPARPHTPPVDAISPYGRVPVFRDGETALFETSAIVRYLEETFDGTPLFAPNARLRAEMEQWVSLINCHAYDAMVRRYVLQYVFAKDGAPDRQALDAALPDIKQLLTILDKAYGTRNFLVGDAVTMADLFLAPIVAYLTKFPESKALLDSVPNVTRAHKAIAERESFKATMPKFD